MAITIKDVARAAGVSPATVSKVINNKMYVSPETREKVLQVMKQLNYVPNMAAANLASQTSKIVLYADSFHKGIPYKNPHMFDIICGVSHELNRKKYYLSLLNIESGEKNVRDFLEEKILSHIADGIIMNGALATPQIESLMLRYDFPHLCIGKPEFETVLSWIDINNSLSANLAVEHLFECGCRKIAFMGDHKSDKIFMDRLHGFRSAMKSVGLEVREEYISYNDPDVNSIYASALQMLEHSDPPDGIICTNSFMIVGTMRAIEAKGLHIPDEICLVAFDDFPYSSAVPISTTIVDIDLFSLGVHAGNVLMKKIKDPAMLIQTYTALPHLLVRGTTRHVSESENKVPK